MFARALCALCFVCLALSSGVPTHPAAENPQQKPSARYDGHWWVSASGYEQFGFLNGYFDCYTYELKGPDRYTSLAVMYQSAITEFYKRGPSPELDVAVSDLLHRLRDPEPPPVMDPFRGHSEEPHGRNDGLYWREISSRGGQELEQLGFVDGYLACHAGLNHEEGGTFSKPAAEYVRSITGWYGFDAATGDIDRRREPTPIADVLFKFRDRVRPIQRLP